MSTPGERLRALANAEAERLEHERVAAVNKERARKQNDFMMRASAKVSAVLGEEAASTVTLVFRGPYGNALQAAAFLGDGFELRYWDCGASGPAALDLFRACPACGHERDEQISGLAPLAHLFHTFAAESALAAQDGGAACS